MAKAAAAKTGTKAAAVTCEVQAVESRYGTARPQIVVCMPGASYRAKNAALYTLAAAVELASEGQKWAVSVDLDAVAVAIELSDGTAAEEAAALAVLRRVAAAR